MRSPKTLVKDFLSQIIQRKKARLKTQKVSVPLSVLKDAIRQIPYRHRPFAKALSHKSRLGLIAELKKASPSKGIIREDFKPCAIARLYEKAGVDAISVLTEEDYFLGTLSLIEDIRKRTMRPLLRKDFIIDEYQMYESRLIGADAVLLIAAIVSAQQLKRFINLGQRFNLECLVEVHDTRDLIKAVRAGAKVIGINNRNLRTFSVDLKTTQRLIKRIPQGVTIVSESGIRTKQDITFLKGLGVDALLAGEVFMSSKKILKTLKQFRQWLR